MNRRTFVAAGVAALAGCSSGGSEDDDEVSWRVEETVYGDYGHTPLIHVGEREEGDSVTFQLTVEKGRYVSATLANRDTSEAAGNWIVYRDDRLDGYNPDEHESSPFQTTVGVPSFGEYALRIATPGNGNEATVRVAQGRTV